MAFQQKARQDALNQALNSLDLDGREDFSNPPSFEESASAYVRTMLRTVFGYAADRPRRVYLAIRNVKNGEGIPTGSLVSAFADINGRVLPSYDLNSGLRRGEERYDTSQSRQRQLAEYLGNDLASLMNLFRSGGRLVPDEIWAGYDLDGETQDLTFVYAFGKVQDDARPFDADDVRRNLIERNDDIPEYLLNID